MRCVDQPSREATGPTAENRSYCKAAYNSLHIAIGGAVMPCCEFRGQIGDVTQTSLGDIWTGAPLRDLRAKMERAERDAGCRQCYDMEDAGGHSLRQIINDGLPPGEIDVRVPASPKMLDIRFSNRCNLKCRTCGPDASSKWHADARKLGWKVEAGALIESFGPRASALEALEPLLDTIEHINFAGGEPLMQEEQYAVVEELIRRGRTDVRLSYISNMTELRFRRKDILALWSHFKHVELIASIDGHKQIGELVRDGISWDRFTKNISAVRAAAPNVHMMFNITVSIFNVHALPDLCRSLNEIEGAEDVEYIFNVLQGPPQFSIQVLPAQMKAQAQRNLEAFAQAYDATPGRVGQSMADRIRPVVSFMNFQDGSSRLKRFRKDTRRLDELRGQDTGAVIPELAPVLRETALEAGLRKAQDNTRTFFRWATGAAAGDVA